MTPIEQADEIERSTRARPHTHEWTGLWSHFGDKGTPDRSESHHFHVCFDRRCQKMMVGLGYNCDGRHSTHVIE